MARHKLHAIGIRGQLLVFLPDYVSEHQQFGGLANVGPAGVSQGSVLGP